MVNTSRVFRGNWGKLIIDGHTFTNVKSVKWNLKASTEKIAQTGSLKEAEVQNGLEQTGEIKFTKTDSYMLKLLIDYVKTGKAQNFTIITSQASDNECKNEEKFRLTGCSFPEIGSEWEAGKISEETYSFTFENIKAITWAEDDV